MNRQPVSIDSEALSCLRNDIEDAITNTLNMMAMTGNGEASIGVKINIRLHEEAIPEGDAFRHITRPYVQHVIKSVVQTVSKTDGVMPSSDYEIAFNKALGEWEFKKLLQQTSMFDD